MGEAFAWGLVGQSTLLIGALIALWRPLSRRTLGLVMAFGSGVLLSAVSFELIERAIDTNQGLRGTTLGFFSGAIVFSVANRLLTRPSKQPTERDITTSTSGLTIVLGALLDGIPESAVLGLTLLQDGRISAAMLVAVVISNLPEGIAATVGLRSSGWPTVKVIMLWTGVIAVCALSAAVGYVALDGASPYTLAFVLAFAAGAILSMLSTSMMPEAYGHAGQAVGTVTVFGFAVALTVNWLQG